MFLLRSCLNVLFISLIMLIHQSCYESNNYNKLVKKWYYKQIVIPDSLDVMIDGVKISTLKDYRSDEMAIISFIDADCHSCIEKLDKWEKVWSDFGNAQILLFIHTHSYSTFESYAHHFNFNRPTVYDRNMTIIKDNNIADLNARTMLIDKNDKVLLIGNPTSSSELKDLYVSIIHKKNLAYTK